MSHANARLTPAGRLTMVQRIAAGRPVAHVAAEMGVSRTTAWRWWRRYRQIGRAGLVDRSSRPHSCPHRTPACVEARIRLARADASDEQGGVTLTLHLVDATDGGVDVVLTADAARLDDATAASVVRDVERTVLAASRAPTPSSPRRGPRPTAPRAPDRASEGHGRASGGVTSATGCG